MGRRIAKAGTAHEFTIDTSTLHAASFESLEPRLLLSGSIEGTLWHDLNADGVHDAGETGLDGRTVELIDRATGLVAATTVTTSIDVNGDGAIDSQSESGLYSFTGLAEGEYDVRQAMQADWSTSLPATRVITRMGPEFEVASEPDNYVSLTDSVIAPSGDFAVSWKYSYVVGAGQRVNADGTLNGAVLPLDVGMSDVKWSDVAMHSSGRYAMVSVRGNDRDEAYVQLFASDGLPVSARVALGAHDYYTRPAIAMNASGEFVAVLAARGPEAEEMDVFAQKFDAGGAPMGMPFRVNTLIAGYQVEPAVTIDDRGDFIVMWCEHSTSKFAMARSFHADGTPKGDDAQVSEQHMDLRAGSLSAATDGQGNAVIVWTGYHTDGPGPSDGDGILARRFRVDGTPIGQPFSVNTQTTNPQSETSVAMDSEGRFIISWTTEGQEAWDVLAQRYNADGTPNGPEFRVSELVDGSRHGGSVAMNESGEVVISYSNDPAGGTRGVSARQFQVDAAHRVSIPAGDATETANFGSYQTASLSGRKFEDTNINGRQDAGEVGSDGVVIELVDPDSGAVLAMQKTVSVDLNGDGTIDPATESGLYSFEGLRPGAYVLRAAISDEWLVTVPAAGDYALTLTSGGVTTGLDLGSARLCDVSGQVFEDFDGSSARDGSDIGLDGWTVELVETSTGTVVATQLTAPVDANGDDAIDPQTEAGRYIFHVVPGAYTVRQVARAGWVQTAPAGATFDLAVTYAQAAPDLKFGNRALPSTISGQKFEDVNDNGVRDPGETGLDGWTIELLDYATGTVVDSVVTASVDVDGDGVIDPASESGLYAFENVVRGEYDIREVSQDGWWRTAPRAWKPDRQEVMANTFMGSSQRDPDVARDSAGNTIVVWMSFAQDGYDGGIFAQRYFPDGRPNGLEFQVNTRTMGSQGKPQVALSDSGRFIIVWEDRFRDGDADEDICARYYDANGVAVGDDFRVNTTTEGDQEDFDVAIDDAGRATVVWDSQYPDGSHRRIYAQRYNVDGAPNGGQTQVIASNPYQQRSPAIAMDGAGNEVIVWWGVDLGVMDGRVMAQRFNADGSLNGDHIVIPASRNARETHVTLNDDGRFVVGWDEGNPPSPLKSHWCTVAPDGTPGQSQGSWQLDGVDDIALMPDGTGVIIVGAPRDHESGASTLAYILNVDGSIRSEAVPVDTTWRGGGGGVAIDDLGRYVVTWAGTDVGTGDVNVFVRSLAAVDGLAGPDVVMDVDQVVTGRDFGSQRLGSVSGELFDDRNGDGVHDPGEVGLDGWRVVITDPANGRPTVTVTTSIDLDGDGQIDPVTESGLYSFANLPIAQYTLTAVIQDGWDQTHPAEDTYAISLGYGENLDPMSFGVQPLRSEIHGQKFEDLNANGLHDAGEPGLDGWTIQLCHPQTGALLALAITRSIDVDGDGQIDPETESGLYDFTELARGTYEVREVTRPGWRVTSPDGPGLAGDGAAVQVNTYEYGRQDEPWIAMNDSGDYVIVWRSYGGVFGQMYNASGMREGGEFQVNTDTFNSHDPPSVAMDDSGRFVVVWGCRARWEVYARLFNADGTPAGDEFLVSTYDMATVSSENPAVAMTGLGDFIITWSGPGPEDFDGIFAQLYMSDGTPKGGPFRVNTLTEGWQRSMVLAADDAGSFVVAWASPVHDAIVARMFLADGAPRGDEIIVGTDPGNVVAVVMGARGDFMVTWGKRGYQMYVRRFDSDGAPLGESFGLLGMVAPYAHRQAVAMDDAGRIIAVGPGSRPVDARLYNADGTPSGQKVGVGPDYPQSNYNAVVAMTGSGHAVVVYVGILDGGQEVYSRALDPNYSRSHEVTVDVDEVVQGADFGAYQPVSVSGQVFEDMDVNGLHGVGEPGLDGWKVRLVDVETGQTAAWQGAGAWDVNDDGTIDEITECGLYSFQDVRPGNYEIQMIAQDGWLQTLPAGPYAMVLTSGDGAVEQDFAASVTGSISGQLFKDVNGDGIRDAGEIGMDGWTVELVDPASGAVLASQTTATADLNGDGTIDPISETGLYIFDDLLMRDYAIRQVDQFGWRPTVPSGGVHSVALGYGADVGPYLFGNEPLPGEISGRKFHDVNGNGARDAGEAGLNGWTIELVDQASGAVVDMQTTADIDLNGDGAIDPITETGVYRFVEVPAGDYMVRDVPQAGWAHLPYSSGKGAGSEELQVNTVTEKSQVTPSIASRADGGSVVVWETGNSDTREFGLRAQLLNADWTPNGGEIIVSLAQPDYVTVGKCVAMTDSGQFLIVWGNNRAGYLNEIRARLYNADGTPRGEAFSLDLGEEGNFRDPTVAINAAGEFVVTAWVYDLAFRGIHARKFAADGTPMGGGIYVSPAGNDPVAAIDDAGRFAIAWAMTDDGTDIFAQWYNADLTPATDAIHVNTVTYHNQWSPDIAMNALGRVVVTWVDGGGQDSDDDGIFARIYNAPGLPSGDEFQVNTYVTDNQRDAAVALDDDGRFVIAWRSSPDVDQPLDVFAQAFAPNGTPNGTEFRVNATTENHQYEVDVAIDGAGRFVFAWKSTDQDGSYDGIYARRFAGASARNYISVKLVEGHVIVDQDFNGHQPATVSGQVFDDPDLSGSKGANETGLDGWQVLLVDHATGVAVAQATTAGRDVNGDGTIDPASETGLYVFESVVPGSYEVTLVVLNGWLQTTLPTTHGMTLSSGGGSAGLAFGSARLNGIAGRKFEDIDGNGVRDAGEAGLDGWTIELVDAATGLVLAEAVTASWDVNGDGMTDPITEAGLYRFEDLHAGTYEVREVLVEGWVRTHPADLAHSVTLLAGDLASERNFGNARGSTISGMMFEDANANAIRDAGEPVLAGWPVEVVDPGSGEVLQAGTTSGDGTYAFGALRPGEYEVRSEMQPGWLQTLPSSGSHTPMLVSGSLVTGLDFGKKAIGGQIRGVKWNDVNADGVHDVGEVGVDGWTIELVDPATGVVIDTQVTASADVNGDGAIDPATESGLYAFTDLVRGAYKVREVARAGWEQTEPGSNGGLTFVEAWTDGQDGVDGLDFPYSATVSNDGTCVYVAGFADDAVAVFTREATTGQLTFVGAWKDGLDGVDGLNGAFAVTASPDGRHVYVAGSRDNAVAVFAQDPTTNALTFVQRVKSGIGGVTGLKGVRDVEVSPDGRHVYAAGNSDDTVTVFSRNATTGELALIETIQNGAGGVDGIDGVYSVVISPDGKNVYAAGYISDALVTFTRDAVTGRLSVLDIIRDGVDGADGLDGARMASVSPDGRHVYLAGYNDNALTLFTRDAATGELTFVRTFRDGDPGVDGLAKAVSVTVSSDGDHVYAVAYGNRVVTVLSRDAATGELAVVQKVSDTGTGPYCAVVSPDGRHVYTTAVGGDRLTVFQRELSSVYYVTLDAGQVAAERDFAGYLIRSEASGEVGLLASSDSGASDGDDLTNRDNGSPLTTLQFAVSGTLAGATVTIYAGSTAIGTAVAGADGTTVVTTSGLHDLADGEHTITARQTEAGKPESPDSAGLVITVDTAAPSVEALGLSSTSTGWTLGAIDSALWITGRTSQTVPWSGIDQLVVSFDEAVVVAAADLTLTGMTGGAANPTGLAGSLSEQAICTLAAPLVPDRCTVVLAAGVTDVAGNAIGVEWSTGLNVLVGDINGDGRVSSRDRRELRDAYGSTTGGAGYDAFADLNGDGRVSSRDRRILRDNYATALPDPPASLGDMDAGALVAARQGVQAYAEDVFAMAAFIGVLAAEAMPTVGAETTDVERATNPLVDMQIPSMQVPILTTPLSSLNQRANAVRLVDAGAPATAQLEPDMVIDLTGTFGEELDVALTGD